MSLQLFGHPGSSYTMKALIVLHENETPFDFRILDPDHPENGAELARRWPVAKFPLLVDDRTTVFETSDHRGFCRNFPGRTRDPWGGNWVYPASE